MSGGGVTNMPYQVTCSGSVTTTFKIRINSAAEHLVIRVRHELRGSIAVVRRELRRTARRNIKLIGQPPVLNNAVCAVDAVNRRRDEM